MEQISKKYRVITLGECLDMFNATGKWPNGCAVITVDDGYRDFYLFAYPVLRNLGLSATFFVTTNFVDQKIWLWPDRLDYALRSTKTRLLKIEIGGKEEIFPLDGQFQISRTWETLTKQSIAVPDPVRLSFIVEIEEKLGVSLPPTPPEQYCAVRWEELREMARFGLEIGSHTLNHPILSKVESDEKRKELINSKRVLEERLQVPVRTFCYPNSSPGDIDAEVIMNVKKAGYIGAVFGTDLAAWDPYLVPRMGLSNNRDDFVCKLAGLEMAVHRLRKKGNGELTCKAQ